MFLKHQRHLSQPVAAVRSGLERPPIELLPIGVTERHEGLFLTRVGIGPAGLSLNKQVELTVGEARPQGDRLEVAIEWRATGPSDLFRFWTGTFGWSRGGPEQSRLSLSATYTPPMGAIGQEADAAIMHAAAETSFRNFVDGVAMRVSRLVEAHSR